MWQGLEERASKHTRHALAYALRFANFLAGTRDEESGAVARRLLSVTAHLLCPVSSETRGGIAHCELLPAGGSIMATATRTDNRRFTTPRRCFRVDPTGLAPLSNELLGRACCSLASRGYTVRICCASRVRSRHCVAAHGLRDDSSSAHLQVAPPPGRVRCSSTLSPWGSIAT